MSATIDFGIDLGTTNSSVAVCRRGEVRVFQTTDLMTVTPSVVYVSKTGRMLVGKKAYDVWVQDPDNTHAEFKRWMGYSDKLAFPASGKQLSAEELSAEVLKSLRADAERQTQERVTSAVITVPAAFGSLQCEATGRAARMAGLEQAPLLQEPIAAAVAYGASPASRDQRWMVFDLGGGTLDIAIVSTRNSRLSILEHQGNNRLGGKDIDRVISEQLLLAPLAEAYNLPVAEDDPKARHRLMRALTRYAEQAKIALSTATEAAIDIFDIGDDLDGNPIEFSLTLKRAEVEARVGPIIDQCITLARRALEGARLSGTDLDRVLMVGGPTQMPVLRNALESALGAKLDHSLDPMTVVAQGAALYASTQEKTAGETAGATAAAVPAGPRTTDGAVRIELACERASGSARSPVAGVIDESAGVQEVKIDAGGGFWTSGWVPVVAGCFGVEVLLQDTKPSTRFSIVGRDRKGNPIRVEPAEFTVAYMLPMAAPPLPHTIAIELSTVEGVTQFDPIFMRHSPLPAEARKIYRADRTLRPSETATTLPIKFWEIDVSEDPQERWWAGCVHVQAHTIKRPIVEGTDIELVVKIDASRKLTVEMFVPVLNQSFAKDVYIPDPPAAGSQLQQQIDLCFERLEQCRRAIYESSRSDLADQRDQLQEWAETIVEQIERDKRQSGTDPDSSLGATAALRKLRLGLTRLEEQLEVGGGKSAAVRRNRSVRDRVQREIHGYANEADHQLFDSLDRQLQKQIKVGDVRGMEWVTDQLWDLRWQVIKDRMEFWESELNALKSPHQKYVNQEQASKSLAEAIAAHEKKDVPTLRSACQQLCKLLTPSKVESARDQESRPGLRTN